MHKSCSKYKTLQKHMVENYPVLMFLTVLVEPHFVLQPGLNLTLPIDFP